MEMDNTLEPQDTLLKVRDLLDNHDMQGVIEILSGMHPSDIARLIENINVEQKKELFALLDPEVASSVVVELSSEPRERVLEDIEEDRLTAIVENLDSDDAADIISELPEDVADSLLDQIPRKDAEDVQKLLEYREDTAGGIMQMELISAPEDASVNWVIEYIRSVADEIGEVHNVYVVSKEKVLLGFVPLSRLILAKPDSLISSIMEMEFPKVSTGLDQEEVARIFKKYDIVVLPVVDDAGRLVGRITVDDVVDVLEEEASEDFYKMAGVGQDERVFDPVFTSFKRRCGWLAVNLCTAIVAASVVGLFQHTIQAFVLLAVYMPIVAGMGGNAGTQTITVIVRGLALGEVEYGNARKALFKELYLGIANGITLGILAGIVSYWWNGNYMLGILVCLAMIINLMIAGLAGTLIPLLLKSLHIDPALASSVFVTTFTDVGGFFTFLGLATIFLRLGLL